MLNKVPITVAYGDGIGPEIMRACLHILDAAGAALDIETIEVGQRAYLNGHLAGIPPEAWDTLRRNRILYKGPITTPQGGGYKSLNVTIRNALGLYANVRPCVSYYPAIDTKHPLMNLVIIRENEEDVYTGIEHRQTDEVYQCLKLISRPGSEKIVRYAFEYARRNNRKKVTCFTKDNIMKMTDGLFHRIYDEIGAEYPDIEKEHWIIDIGTAKMADRPDQFEVIVVPNLYGDILSDVAAQLTGSVGLGDSANVGNEFAMFEAIHGSAPDIAGKNIANPSGLLLAGVTMLVHIGQPDVAERIHNAWLTTIESGTHTGDIYRKNFSKALVNTDEFTDTVIKNLGRQPEKLRPVKYAFRSQIFVQPPLRVQTRTHKELVGVDIFLDWEEADGGRDANHLAALMEDTLLEGLELAMITNRGQRVWPDGLMETFCTDHWRCRVVAAQEGQPITHAQIVALLGRLTERGLDFIKTENLFTFDGQPGYSIGEEAH